MKPGVYPGLPMAEYLAAEAVSASLISAAIEECPRAAWYRSWLNPKRERDTGGAAQDNGTIAHSILLEGHADRVVVIEPKDHPAKTKPFAIPKGWTNDSIKEARDAVIASGKVAVLPDQMAEIRAMVDAAREFIDSLRETEPAIWAIFQPGGGDSELTLVWDDEGTPCRIRPDRISTDRRVIGDYKTGGTTAEPDTWGRRQMLGMGYHVSAGFYRRGVKAVFGVTPTYVWLVQEQAKPYLCSLVGMDAVCSALADRKALRGLNTWKACAKSGTWPGYPNRVCYPELPAYEFTREDAVETGGHSYDYGAMGWNKERLNEFVDSMP